MAGFPSNEEIELYEEIKFEPTVMCERIDKKLTFRSSELEDGDIICYQKSPPLDSDDQYRYPDVPSFLDYVHNRQEVVAKEFGIPVQFQRFWLWVKRRNHTYRPNRPLTPPEESQSVGQLRGPTDKAHNGELKLFLEVELGPVLCPLPPPDKTKEDILLFFKLYDPEKEELRYVCRLFVKALGKPAEILTKLNEIAGFPSNEEIELYEEIKFEPTVMCVHIDKKLTFRSSELEMVILFVIQNLLP